MPQSVAWFGERFIQGRKKGRGRRLDKPRLVRMSESKRCLIFQDKFRDVGATIEANQTRTSAIVE